MIPKIQKNIPNPKEDYNDLLRSKLLSHFQDNQKENAGLAHQNQSKNNKAKEYFSNPQVEAKKEAINKLHQEEQVFMERINKASLTEDPLSVWLEYYKWVERNYSNNENKKVEVLESITKTFASSDKYKKDERYIKKWATYAEFCNDKEDMIKYMEENHIGTTLATYYRICMVVYEQQRKFSLVNNILLQGKRNKAIPEENIDNFIKGFETRMLDRLKRDFYSHNKRICEDDIIEIPVVYNDEEQNDPCNFLISSQDSNSNGPMKRKFPFQESRASRKKVRLNELVSSKNMGDFNIFVDPDCHEAIPQSSKLVNEYEALCYKYKFSLAPASQQRSHVSWISKQLSKVIANNSLNLSSTFLEDKTDIPLVNQFQLPKDLRKPLREVKIIKRPQQIFESELTNLLQDVPEQQIASSKEEMFDKFIFNSESLAKLARQDTRDTQKEEEQVDLMELFGLLRTEKRPVSPKRCKKVSLEDTSEMDSETKRKFRMNIKKTPHPHHKTNLLDLVDDDEEEIEEGDEDGIIDPLEFLEKKKDIKKVILPKESKEASPVNKNLNFDNLDLLLTPLEAGAGISVRRSLSNGDPFGEDQTTDKVDNKKKAKKVLGLKNTKQAFTGPMRVIPAVYRNEKVDKENGISDFERYINNQISFNELMRYRQESPSVRNDLLYSKQKPNYLAS